MHADLPALLLLLHPQITAGDMTLEMAEAINLGSASAKPR